MLLPTITGTVYLTLLPQPVYLMPRIARVVLPHHPHHVIQRGNRRQETFFSDDDYRLYLELVSAACRQHATAVWAYCLMPNHVHLVMVPSDEDGLRASLGEAHRRYTRHINFRNDWRGHLWQERFHSFPMDETHLLSAARYVERNPVKAGLVRNPVDWPWSSARAHLEGRDDELVQVRPMLDIVGDWASYLSAENPTDEDNRIERHARTGRPLGDARFVETAERISGRRLQPGRPGPRPKRKGQKTGRSKARKKR